VFLHSCFNCCHAGIETGCFAVLSKCNIHDLVVLPCLIWPIIDGFGHKLQSRLVKAHLLIIIAEETASWSGKPLTGKLAGWNQARPRGLLEGSSPRSFASGSFSKMRARALSPQDIWQRWVLIMY
jgi:hypothetical protein